jgi:GMP synthase-like glutamine amidotransferase
MLTNTNYIIIIIIIIISATASQRGLWLPRPRGFLITHSDAPHSVGLLCTSDQLVAETST